MDKQTIRAEILERRGSISPDTRQFADHAICEQLFQLSSLTQAGTVMLYIDFRGEVDTTAIRERLWSQGKRIVAPITKMQERELIPVCVEHEGQFTTGAYGISEPIFDEKRVAPVTDIDVILIPGLGFDEAGHRLGYGGGFYDRFLPRLRSNTPKIALAYELQMLEHVPTDPHDILMDVIVTEKRLIQIHT